MASISHVQPARIWQTLLVQVGANDGSPQNDRLVHDYLRRNTTRALLIEGNPNVFELLKKNIGSIYHDREFRRLVPVNSVVCEEGNHVQFWIPAANFSSAFPEAPHWVKYQLSSINRESIVSGLRLFLKRRGLSPEDAELYIEPLKVACSPLSSILLRNGVKDFRDVDVLAIDAEGYDAHILMDTLEGSSELTPRVIVFEQKVAAGLYPEKLNAVLDLLSARGYQFDCDKTNRSPLRYSCRHEDVTAKLNHGFR